MEYKEHGFSVEAFGDLLKNLDHEQEASTGLIVLESRLLALWISVQYSYGFRKGWAIPNEDSEIMGVSEALDELDSLAECLFKKLGATK